MRRLLMLFALVAAPALLRAQATPITGDSACATPGTNAGGVTCAGSLGGILRTMDRNSGHVVPFSQTSAYITITGTASITGADQTNTVGRGIIVVVNVTTLTGTSPTITPAIQMKDAVSATYIQLHAAFTAIAATGTFTYVLYPGVGAAAGGITATGSVVVPATFRVVLTYGGTVTATAGTVAYHLIP